MGDEIRDINWKRQIDIFDPSAFDDKLVTIAGLGNIGSQSALALARLGFTRFQLYDHDHVEGHNLASQSYEAKDIGKPKAKALAEHLEVINPEIVSFAICEKFDATGRLGDVLILAADTMQARKEFFKTILSRESGDKPLILIDARMGGGQLEIYTLVAKETDDGNRYWEEDDYAKYEATLVDNPDSDPCGARFISYVSMITGALIAKQLKRVLKGEDYKKSILFHIDTLDLIKE